MFGLPGLSSYVWWQHAYVSRDLDTLNRGCVTAEVSSLMQLTNDASRHQFLAQMPKAKVSWLLCIGRLVSKTGNVMHFAHLVKQASVDLVSRPICLFGAYITKVYSSAMVSSNFYSLRPLFTSVLLSVQGTMNSCNILICLFLAVSLCHTHHSNNYSYHCRKWIQCKMDLFGLMTWFEENFNLCNGQLGVRTMTRFLLKFLSEFWDEFFSLSDGLCFYLEFNINLGSIAFQYGWWAQ